jgi:hypothetical protein
VPPPVRNHPSFALSLTFTQVQVWPPSCEDEHHTVCEWSYATEHRSHVRRECLCQYRHWSNSQSPCSRSCLPFFLFIGVPNRHAVHCDRVTGDAPPQAIKRICDSLVQRDDDPPSASASASPSKRWSLRSKSNVHQDAWDEQIVDRTPDRKPAR